jgi:hypothetical protein
VPEDNEKPIRVVSSRSLDALFPPYRHFNFLLGTARDLVERQPEAAIATAQMAFESFTLFALERLLRVHGIEAPLSERLSATVGGSLMDRPSRDLWNELVGEPINSAPGGAWRSYHDHVERRNRMVHAGGRATSEEATASVDAVRALMDWMIDSARKTEQITSSPQPNSRDSDTD